MPPELPVIQTPTAPAAENLALDRAALASGRKLLRFHRSRPAVLIGRHQRLSREARVDYCRRKGIALLRRPTGGGAIYVDEGQLAFSLTYPDPWSGLPLAFALEKLCRAIAKGLRSLGIPATFRPFNDLEVGGRKIASAFLLREGGRLLLQGTLLVKLDVGRALCALRMPTEKLSRDGLASARQRLASLDDLDLSLSPRTLGEALARSLAETLEARPRWSPSPLKGSPPQEGESREPEGLEVMRKTPGGWLQACFSFGNSGRIEGAWLGGDVMAAPADLFEGLGQAFQGRTLAEAEVLLDHLPIDGVGFGTKDLRHLLRLGREKKTQRDRLSLTLEEANRLMIVDPGEASTQTIPDRARVMLVPYCAKPSWCKWRHRTGCPQCGRCEVGEAYRLGEERGMEVITICNFEHLSETLKTLRKEGTPYVGMCCRHFFIKRQAAFQEARLPALLMDIEGANCYELRQEEDAYAGTFEAEARLDVRLLRKVMKRRKT